MTKEEFISNLQYIPEDLYENIINQYIPKKSTGGTIEINGSTVDFEEVNMEEFFNEEIDS